MNVSEIIYRVKAAIGEVMDLNNPRLAESFNSDNLEQIITDKISYAFEWVIQNAPVSLLEGELTSFIDKSAASYKSDNVVEVELPSDVLRIVSARLSSWASSPSVSDEHSQTAKMQGYATSRGTYDNPCCVLYSENGKQILRMFSAHSNRDDIYINVIRIPVSISNKYFDGDAEINLPSRLEASFIYYMSGLVVQAMGEDSRAYFEIATLNLKKDG